MTVFQAPFCLHDVVWRSIPCFEAYGVKGRLVSVQALIFVYMFDNNAASMSDTVE